MAVLFCTSVALVTYSLPFVAQVLLWREHPALKALNTSSMSAYNTRVHILAIIGMAVATLQALGLVCVYVQLLRLSPVSPPRGKEPEARDLDDTVPRYLRLRAQLRLFLGLAALNFRMSMLSIGISRNLLNEAFPSRPELFPAAPLVAYGVYFTGLIASTTWSLPYSTSCPCERGLLTSCPSRLGCGCSGCFGEEKKRVGDSLSWSGKSNPPSPSPPCRLSRGGQPYPVPAECLHGSAFRGDLSSKEPLEGQVDDKHTTLRAPHLGRLFPARERHPLCWPFLPGPQHLVECLDKHLAHRAPLARRCNPVALGGSVSGGGYRPIQEDALGIHPGEKALIPACGWWNLPGATMKHVPYSRPAHELWWIPFRCQAAAPPLFCLLKERVLTQYRHRERPEAAKSRRKYPKAYQLGKLWIIQSHGAREKKVARELAEVLQPHCAFLPGLDIEQHVVQNEIGVRPTHSTRMTTERGIQEHRPLAVEQSQRSSGKECHQFVDLVGRRPGKVCAPPEGIESCAVERIQLREHERHTCHLADSPRIGSRVLSVSAHDLICLMERRSRRIPREEGAILGEEFARKCCGTGISHPLFFKCVVIVPAQLKPEQVIERRADASRPRLLALGRCNKEQRLLRTLYPRKQWVQPLAYCGQCHESFEAHRLPRCRARIAPTRVNIGSRNERNFTQLNTGPAPRQGPVRIACSTMQTIFAVANAGGASMAVLLVPHGSF